MHDVLQICAWTVLLGPLAGAILTGVLGPKVLRGASHWPVLLGVGSAAGAALYLLAQVFHHPDPIRIDAYDWLPAAASDSWFKFQFLIDPLTAVMLATVTVVAFLVVTYSRDYMRHDHHPERGYERYFAYLGLFVFAMCTLVLGGNFLMLYLGWEAVGVCSYLLIGFYYDRPAAAAAAKKAFVVNRIGDFGFGLGILLIFISFNTLDYHQVFEMVKSGTLANGDLLTSERLTAIALLLFCGACGKSAQLPLHVWLPDAMEGPSPVSALIHAATMVTAGVYMVARCGVIFAGSSLAMTVVVVVGITTALFAATIAIVQTDMKRILAYSTISQLGYMFLALGVGASGAAVFHLFTHAFFKALLFLGAGSVMHAMGGIIDLRRFGGLRRKLPWTFFAIFIGCAALAGVPGLSGFISKDEIIHAAWTSHWMLGALGLLTAAITAFYTFRMLFLAFFGEERIPEGVHAHDSGPWMLTPMLLLCVGAVGAGYLGTEFLGTPFHHFLQPILAESSSEIHMASTHEHVGWLAQNWLMVVSGAIAIGAILLAYLFYVAQPWIPDAIRNSAVEIYDVLWNRYYVDELYDRLVVRPLRALGRACVAVDDFLIDGLLWCITAIPRGLGLALQSLQNGLIQRYAAMMILGTAAIAAIVLWW